MLKDAKIHFFAILWFLFWRKKLLLQTLTVSLSHVMLGFRRFQKACHSNPPFNGLLLFFLLSWRRGPRRP